MTDGVVVVIKNGDNHLAIAHHGEISSGCRTIYGDLSLGKAPPRKIS
jgi:hypothetical protein